MIDSTHTSEKKNLHKLEQINYFTVLISPLVFLLILFTLNAEIVSLEKSFVSIFSNNLLSLIIYMLIFLSIGDIIICYLLLIPFSRKEKGLKDPHPTNMLILAIGALEIEINGLLFGVIFWEIFNFIPFYFVIPFIVFGTIHGIYLYYKYIKKRNENQAIFNKN